jgi:hypothetical protein
MDFNVISRLESHGKDLFLLERKAPRLRPVAEGAGERESESLRGSPRAASGSGPGSATSASSATGARFAMPSRGRKLSGVSEDVDLSLAMPASLQHKDPRTMREAREEGDGSEEEEGEGGSKDSSKEAEASSEDSAAGAGSALAREEALMANKHRADSSSASSASLDNKQRRKKHYDDLFAAFTRNMGKGFILGWLGKVGLNLLYPILNLVRGRKLGLTRELVLFDAREYGLFMGSILAIYNATMFETAKYVKHVEPLRRFRGALAGVLGGLSLLWVPHDKRWPIVSFSLVRALELQALLAHKAGLVPGVPHSDVALMCAASASMLHSWIYHPKTLDAAYAGFLQKQSQQPTAVRQMLGDMFAGRPIDLAAINKERAQLGQALLASATDYDEQPTRLLLHPGASGPLNTVRFFARALAFAVPVYLPVFSVPILLFYPQLLLKRPVETARRVLEGVARSSLFLSLYTTCGFNTVILLRNMGLTYANTGRAAHLIFALAGVVGGASTFVEKKSRRIELALYVLTKAIEGRWNQVVQTGFKPWKNGDVLVFMYCFAVFAHAYTSHRELMRSTYSGLMSKFFDHDERHEFYSMPRILSEQLITLGKRSMSQRILSTIKLAQDEAAAGEDDAAEDEPRRRKTSVHRSNSGNGPR